MTAPQRAAEALARAVENQRAQREAAEAARKPLQISAEADVETPETDRERQ